MGDPDPRGWFAGTPPERTFVTASQGEVMAEAPTPLKNCCMSCPDGRMRMTDRLEPGRVWVCDVCREEEREWSPVTEAWARTCARLEAEGVHVPTELPPGFDEAWTSAHALLVAQGADVVAVLAEAGRKIEAWGDAAPEELERWVRAYEEGEE